MAVNIDGNGLIALGGTSSTQGRLRLAEDTDNGTNYIELTAPASVGSDRTITFPDATTTVVGTDTTQTLTNKSIVATQLTGTIAAARLPAGSVLQVVSTTKTDTFSASLARGAVSGDAITASITPTSSSSKILVLFNGSFGNSNTAPIYILLYKGGSVVSGATGDSAGNRLRSSAASFISNAAYLANLNINYLDSPATTSSTTYSIRIGHGSGETRTLYLNRSADDVDFDYATRTASFLTLVEIAG